MLGRSLSLENVKRFAISEFLQVVASTILIILLINLVSYAAYFTFTYLIGGGSTVLCAGTQYSFTAVGGQIGDSPISFAKCRVQERISELEALHLEIFTNNLKTEALSQTCYSFAGIQAYCGYWTMYGDVERAHLVASKIPPLLIHLHAQYSILDYISANMLAIFLPIGILLRAIPLTRGAGGLFIAAALGFYFLLPAFIVVMDPTYVRGESPPSGGVESPMVFNSCYPGFSGVSTLMEEVEQGASGNSAQLDLFTSQIAQITVGTMFYPFIALALTLIFVRTAAPILGGDAGELTRMVSKVL